jgi:hypothetical protein
LELLPLIRAVKADVAAESAVYFFDRASRHEVRWLSYDSQSQPEVITAIPDWLPTFLADLDAPSRGGEHADVRDVRARDDGLFSTDPIAPGRGGGRSAATRTSIEDLPQLIEDALKSAAPFTEALRGSGATSFMASSRFGWIEYSKRPLRLVCHVPIELAPQVAGPVMYEIPASTDDRAATQIYVEDQADTDAAMVLLIGALAIDQGWRLDGPETIRAIRRAPTADDAEAHWGAGTWPPASMGPRAQLGVWQTCVTELRARAGFSGSSARASPEGLRMSWGEGVDVGLRMDATSCYVFVELDDRGAHRTRVDRLLARKAQLDGMTDAESYWYRRVGSLVIVERIGNPEGPAGELATIMVDGLIRVGQSVAKATT